MVIALYQRIKMYNSWSWNERSIMP